MVLVGGALRNERHGVCVTLFVLFLLFCCHFEGFCNVRCSFSFIFKECRLVLFVKTSCRHLKGLIVTKEKKRGILPPNVKAVWLTRYDRPVFG